MDGGEGSQGSSADSGRAVELQLAHRLATARGHLDAVMRMVDGGRQCTDVIHQIGAVQGILTVARHDLLARHLQECVVPRIAAGRVDAVHDLLAAVFGSEPEAMVSTNRQELNQRSEQ